MKPIKAVEAVLVVSLLLWGASAASAAEVTAFPLTTPASAEEAPRFTLEDLSGEKRSLDEFRGKVVVLNFWASWCVPCKREFPALKELHRRLGPRGLVVLAVAEDSRKRAAPFAAEMGLDFPVLIDRFGSVMADYNVVMLPTTVVVGRDGRVVGRAVGERDFGGEAAFGFFSALIGEKMVD